MLGEVKIYRCTVSYGEFVYCACGFKQLYSFLYADTRMRMEVLGTYKGKNGEYLDSMRVIGYKEFLREAANKFIIEEPFHLGFLGGYQE